VLDVDVLAPCALGGALNAEVSRTARRHCRRRRQQPAAPVTMTGASSWTAASSIVPDFLINAGGIIDVHYQRSGLDRSALAAHIDAIGERLHEVLRRADASQRPTSGSPRSWRGRF
jgi:leucine dehydrogenase